MKTHRLGVGGFSVSTVPVILLIWGAIPYFLTALFMA
jgi:hypothetical protein